MLLKYVKKFLEFEKKKKKYNKDDEINAISDDKEFLDKLPVESLIDLNLNFNKIYLRKELFNNINGLIACIGQHGQGKSSLCSAFYKIFYGIDKEIFTISNSTLNFRKGLMVIKESIRQTIKENIIKDIIDTEGFKVDDLSTWKYIMIVVFIATDIIIVNRKTCMDDVKNILSIVWNSLDKMNNLGLPKMLKNIWIQIDDEENVQKFGEIMYSIDNSTKKWEKKGIKLNSFLLKSVEKEALRNAKNNILEIEFYLEQAKEAFEKILNSEKNVSISTIIPFIDNFNIIMNAIETFNNDKFKKIENDFKISYSIVKNRKETQLLKDFSDKLTPPKTSDESFKGFINRHNINLSFNKKDVTDKFTFYQRSPELDEIYNKLIYSKDFKANSNIFKDKYDLLIEKVKLEEKKKNNEEKLKKLKEDFDENKIKFKNEEERLDINIRYINKQLDINNYFNQLKFYEYIESYSSSKYNIDINYEYENNLKNEYNDKIIDYYYKKKEEKKQQWQKQIDEAKYLRSIQSYGVMECINGHKFFCKEVACGKCKEKGIDFDDRLLYWVDVDEHYGICKHCNVVRKISEKIECGICGSESLSKIKFID